MFSLILLWCGVSVPLVFLGAWIGFGRESIELPVRTNAIPRQIPQQPWFTQPLVTSLIGGVLPFGAVFTELFFILSSIWQHQFYYLFGFLFLVLIILIVTCSEVSISLAYFQLTAEDWRWWWRSFFVSGSSAGFIFLYSVLYFFSKLQVTKTVTFFIYFGWMSVASLTFMLLTGTVGTISTFFFVRAIYGSIKID